jgi:hypothetical protein
MGARSQKEEFVSNELDVSIDVLSYKQGQPLKTSPCVYLFSIGLASQILKDDTYTDDIIVCKYGTTTNFKMEFSKQEKYFMTHFNASIKCLYHKIIDPIHIMNAKTSMRQYFEAYNIDNDNRLKLEKSVPLTELDTLNVSNLIIIHKSIHRPNIKSHFTLMNHTYIGCYTEEEEEVQKLQSIINNLEFKLSRKDLKYKDLLLLQNANL